MKILVKKEVCGSCEQCMGPTRKDRKALLKKKKKPQSTDAQRYHQYPNKYLVVEICVCVCG